MKIGIGITTRNRPEVLKMCLEQIAKHTPSSVKVFVVDDHSRDDHRLKNFEAVESVGVGGVYNDKRLGVAGSKNVCLKELQGCDYVFLLDDDLIPIADNWIDFYIRAHEVTGQHHFLYMVQNSTLRITGRHEGVEVFNNCGGCFMFLTKEAIDTVGAFNPKYGVYGMEHAGYSERVHLAGLTPMGKYLNVAGSDMYLHAMDYQWRDEFNGKIDFKSSLNNEWDKIGQYIKYNQAIYEQDIKQIFQPL